MRRDMKRVVIETLRYGGSKKRRHRLFREIDDAPTKESMKRTYKSRKYFGDRTNPLVRFLHKQVGRKWIDVYSEIVAVSDKRNPAGAHLRSHISDTVDRQNKDAVSRWYYRDLFVDEDGFLRRRHKKKYSQYRRQPEYLTLDDGRLAKTFNGLWFFVDEIEFTVRELDRLTSYLQKILVYRYIKKTEIRKTKQMNKKELRQNDLKNALR